MSLASSCPTKPSALQHSTSLPPQAACTRTPSQNESGASTTGCNNTIFRFTLIIFLGRFHHMPTLSCLLSLAGCICKHDSVETHNEIHRRTNLAKHTAGQLCTHQMSGDESHLKLRVNLPLSGSLHSYPLYLGSRRRTSLVYLPTPTLKAVMTLRMVSSLTGELACSASLTSLGLATCTPGVTSQPLPAGNGNNHNKHVHKGLLSRPAWHM